MKAGLTALSVAVLGAFALLSPLSVQAFWPFGAAQAATGDVPVLHDTSSVQLLAAALNLNPDPNQGDSGLTFSDGSALMATLGPDGSSTIMNDQSASAVANDSTNASDQATISVYTVKDGDSISSIASHFGVSVNTILWANSLTMHSNIKPGMSLNILPVSGIEHTVASGETLSSIAAKYHASADEIATFNGLESGASVAAGTDLIIPGGSETPAASKEPVKSVKTATPPVTTKTTSKPAEKAAEKTAAKVSAKSDLGSASDSGGYIKNPVPGAILTQGLHGKNGVDLGAPSGTPIHASASGTVIISKADGGWNGGYGSYVVISHPNGMQTLYSHMSSNIASVGESVSQGQVIGYVGETGEATGNHLHFEVRGGRNPFAYSCTEMSRCY